MDSKKKFDPFLRAEMGINDLLVSFLRAETDINDLLDQFLRAEMGINDLLDTFLRAEMGINDLLVLFLHAEMGINDLLDTFLRAEMGQVSLMAIFSRARANTIHRKRRGNPPWLPSTYANRGFTRAGQAQGPAPTDFWPGSFEGNSFFVPVPVPVPDFKKKSCYLEVAFFEPCRIFVYNLGSFPLFEGRIGKDISEEYRLLFCYCWTPSGQLAL